MTYLVFQFKKRQQILDKKYNNNYIEDNKWITIYKDSNNIWTQQWLIKVELWEKTNHHKIIKDQILEICLS